MTNLSRRLRLSLLTALAALLFLSVAALATGKPGKPKPVQGAQVTGAQVTPAQHQYGRNKVAICHKGKTKMVPLPAVSGHRRHGDTVGPCP